MNKIILIGNVGADPVVRMMPDGVTKVAQVRLATTRRGYTKQDGTQVPDRTTWHTLIFWRRLADTVGQYVHKGDRIGVEGSYESREYAPDKNNPQVTQTVYEVTVDSMEMLAPKQQAQAQSPMGHAPVPPPAPAPAPQPQYGTGQAPYGAQQGTAPFPQSGVPQAAPAGGTYNDDLPF